MFVVLVVFELVNEVVCEAEKSAHYAVVEG
jgi:hypothetical protein